MISEQNRIKKKITFKKITKERQEGKKNPT